MKLFPYFEISVNVGLFLYKVIELIVLELLYIRVYNQSP